MSVIYFDRSTKHSRVVITFMYGSTDCSDVFPKARAAPADATAQELSLMRSSSPMVSATS